MDGWMDGRKDANWPTSVLVSFLSLGQNSSEKQVKRYIFRFMVSEVLVQDH
jgi:hypothetical protein